MTLACGEGTASAQGAGGSPLRFRGRALALAGCLVVWYALACSAEPVQPIDPVGDWALDLTLSSGSGTCTVTGALLRIEGAGPPISGEVTGGSINCTGDGAWPGRQVVHGTLGGESIALGLGLPGAGDFPLVLEGKAQDNAMSGTIRVEPEAQEAVSGHWSAARSTGGAADRSAILP